MAGYLRQRSPGSWFLQWSLGKKDGKYQKASKTFYGKKKDAQAELDRIIQEVRSGNYVSPTKTTVADFLRKWLEIYAEKQVAGSTFERYKGIVEQHLIPALGNKRRKAVESREYRDQRRGLPKLNSYRRL